MAADFEQPVAETTQAEANNTEYQTIAPSFSLTECNHIAWFDGRKFVQETVFEHLPGEHGALCKRVTYEYEHCKKRNKRLSLSSTISRDFFVCPYYKK